MWSWFCILVGHLTFQCRNTLNSKDANKNPPDGSSKDSSGSDEDSKKGESSDTISKRLAKDKKRKKDKKHKKRKIRNKKRKESVQKVPIQKIRESTREGRQSNLGRIIFQNCNFINHTIFTRVTECLISRAIMLLKN